MRWRKDTFQKNDEPKAENFFIIVSMAVGYKITAVSIFESIILQKDIFRLGHEIKNALHLVEENSISKIVRFQTIFGKKKNWTNTYRRILTLREHFYFLLELIRHAVYESVWWHGFTRRALGVARQQVQHLHHALFSLSIHSEMLPTQNELSLRTMLPFCEQWWHWSHARVFRNWGYDSALRFFLFANEGQSAPFLLGNT